MRVSVPSSPCIDIELVFVLHPLRGYDTPIAGPKYTMNGQILLPLGVDVLDTPRFFAQRRDRDQVSLFQEGDRLDE